MCLLLLAGDIEDNPGPRQPKFPCGECGKAVTFIVANTRKLALAKTRSKRLAIACDDCNTWFHADCLGMSLNCYNAVAHPDASWHCCSCGVPHFTSSFFESFQLNNSLSTSADEDSHNLSFSDTLGPSAAADPPTTSSPDPGKHLPVSRPNDVLHILILNFCSILPKKVILECACRIQPRCYFGMRNLAEPICDQLRDNPSWMGRTVQKKKTDKMDVGE